MVCNGGVLNVTVHAAAQLALGSPWSHKQAAANTSAVAMVEVADTQHSVQSWRCAAVTSSATVTIAVATAAVAVAAVEAVAIVTAYLPVCVLICGLVRDHHSYSSVIIIVET
jgi:hypothetical protein